MADAAASERALAERNLAVDDCASRGDAVQLATLFNEDFRYTHSNGMSQTKRDYVDAVAARKGAPLRRLSENVVEVHDDVGVTRGNIDVVYSDGKPTLLLRYVRVWRLVGGEWMAISQRTVLATDRQS